MKATRKEDVEIRWHLDGIKSLQEYGMNKKPSVKVWKTPEGTWAVIVRHFDAQGYRITNFIGPYPTRAIARTTQRGLRQYNKYL